MSALGKAYDAGHVSFLELIKVITTIAGAEFAKGTLIKTGTSSAKQFKQQDYPNWEAFIKALESKECPVAQFEGTARHYGDGVFGLPACPFASSIKTYTSVTGGLPQDYKSVTKELNKDSTITSNLRIGNGAAVSPFCGVHQSIRSALGSQLTIGGKKVTVYQLGCKSGSGVKGIAEGYCKTAMVAASKVEEVLDDNMCCYKVAIED